MLSPSPLTRAQTDVGTLPVGGPCVPRERGIPGSGSPMHTGSSPNPTLREVGLPPRPYNKDPTPRGSLGLSRECRRLCLGRRTQVTSPSSSPLSRDPESFTEHCGRQMRGPSRWTRLPCGKVSYSGRLGPTTRQTGRTPVPRGGRGDSLAWGP